MADVYCSDCGGRVPAVALTCPSCHRLMHADRLEALSREATASEATDPATALRLWREALPLLPVDSKQAAFVQTRIAEMSARARTAAPPPKAQPAWIKSLGPLAAVGAGLWKFKTVLLVALSKGKFLLLGLSKLSTLLSMLASVGLYWSWFGWQFALGFIGGIYIHEMGHVWALRQLGLRASAPMFIPGFGAIVSLYDSPANVYEDARIGLAGPIWGAAAGIGFLVIATLTNSGLWFAVARSTAMINLFNLTPVWQLDGGRGFRALDYKQRLMIGGLILALWWVTGEGLLFILALGAAYRIFWQKDHAVEGDSRTLIEFAGLLALFAAMMALIPVRQ
ncbi:MAG: site-2 protease family protein [Bryobacteraceae bacterium]